MTLEQIGYAVWWSMVLLAILVLGWFKPGKGAG